jgi:pyrroline-5-carboxylate reductase
MKLTIIGAGAMAMAMAKGLENRYELEFVVRDTSKVDNSYNAFHINDFNINNKNIILAIKPYALESVAQQLKGVANTIYSLLAGTSIENIKNNIDSKYYIRTMPNISAKFGASTTVITGDIEKKDKAIEIFSSIGDTFWVDTQKEIDIATAVAGSGPAFLALIGEAMMDGLVREGMKRADAIDITNSLFRGFSPLLSSNHPAIIKDMVMSPAGTTSAGYAILENRATRSAFMEAIREAFKVTQR